MKTLKKAFILLTISTFIFSCTPQELVSSDSDIDLQEELATGDGDDIGVDDDRDN